METSEPPADLPSTVEALRAAPRPRRRPFPLARDVRRRVRELTTTSTSPLSSRSWVPDELAALAPDRRAALVSWYVAVDDHDEDTTVLSAAPWPSLDDRHRLAFSRALSKEHHVAAEALQRFLEENRCRVTPDGLLAVAIAGDEREFRRRPVRVGDVFAFSDAALRKLLGREIAAADPLVVIDVTASAREAAKIAFYAAAARPINPRRRADRELAEIAWAEQGAEDSEA